MYYFLRLVITQLSAVAAGHGGGRVNQRRQRARPGAHFMDLHFGSKRYLATYLDLNFGQILDAMFFCRIWRSATYHSTSKRRTKYSSKYYYYKQ
jgi:hypothetical protein